MYHYFYKITNNINNHFYYGIHSTSNLDDGYMGSGVALHCAYKRYGIENFTKEILKFFDNRSDLEKYEEFIVNEDLIKDAACYNIAIGGRSPYLSDKHKESIKKSLKQINHQQGELNSHYNTVWVNNGIETRIIPKELLEEFINKGYSRGRKIKHKDNIVEANKNKIWVNKNGKTKFIYKSELKEYILDGWLFGRCEKISKRTLKRPGYIFFIKLYNEIYNRPYPIKVI